MNDQQANALFEQSIRLLQENKAQEALKLLTKLDQALPSNPGILYFTATGHSIAGDKQKAIQTYERVLRLNPQFIEAYNNLALDLRAVGQENTALQALDQALSIQPNFTDALINKGSLLNKMGSPDLAARCFQKALELEPNNLNALCGLGKTKYEIGSYQDAIRLFEFALAVDPKNTLAITHLAVSYQELGDHKTAAQYFFQNSEEIQSESLLYHYALFQLQTLLLDIGWVNYALRWKESDLPVPYIQTINSQWEGQKTNEPVLIWHEQGIGDQILFGTLLSEAVTLAPNLLVRLDARLVPLFQRTFPSIKFIPHDHPITDNEFKYHCPIGDLARLLRNTAEEFEHQPDSYLKADNTRTKTLRDALSQNSPVIGLAWATKGKRAKERNIPIDALVELIQNTLPSTLVDLQYSDTTHDRDRIAQNLAVTIRRLGEVDNFHDLDGLAALISACDLVITCSNSTAHLAGALGKETYLLVPFSRGRHWYWSHIREDGHSMWYPSIRLIPQTIADDWTKPLKSLSQILGVRKGTNL